MKLSENIKHYIKELTINEICRNNREYIIQAAVYKFLLPKIEQLEQEKEKMKTCWNCKHHYFSDITGFPTCKNCSTCDDKYSKWELKQ